jgi:hypothetical protein
MKGFLDCFMLRLRTVNEVSSKTEYELDAPALYLCCFLFPPSSETYGNVCYFRRPVSSRNGMKGPINHLHTPSTS